MLSILCLWKIFRSANARTCYSSLKLSDFVGYLDATDWEPERTVGVVHVDIAAVDAEVVGVGLVTGRSRGPIGAYDTSKGGIAVAAAAIAGSREENLRN